MNTKVDPNKVDELSVEFNKLSRIIEDGEIGINKEISALIRETNYQYSESYVRSATRESESLLREIRLLAESINEELSNKSKVLKSAASRYKKDEEEAKKEAKKTNPFTLVRTIFKSIAAKWMKGAKKAYEAFSSVVDGLGLGFLLGKGTNKYHEPSINLPLDISPLESNLKKSSKKSAEVEKLQQRLKDLGYDIKVDGYFGDQTLAIVNEYKKKYGLANTCDYEGVVDNQTWLYLFFGLSGELKYDPKKYLENVRMAQIRLKDLGYDVEITGYFDDKTLKAVNEFKGNNKLGNIGDWEGVIGPQTWGVLFGAGAVAQITAEPQSNIELPDTGTGGELLGFEAVLATFPESYHAGLRAMHEAHPSWKFEAYNTGVSFNSFIDKEMSKGHVCTPEAKYGCNPPWRDPQFAYDHGYYAASREAVSYFMDPRNFMNDTYVFQFMSANYDPATQNIDAVNKVLSGTALADYASTFLSAGGQEVSAAFLAAKSRVETGGGTSALATGAVEKYEGYYNLYGLGAYDGNAGVLGAKFAMKRGWNTTELGIMGGAKYIDKNYVDRGQDTLYTMKWNIDEFKSSADVSGQYATHIKDAYNKADAFAKGLKNIDAPICFRIPVYNGMPDTPSPEPK